MVVIVDYGMGNIESIVKAARALGAALTVSGSVSAVKRAKKLILPGVGHFGEAIRQLKERRLFSLIIKKAREGVPFLGICVGMQLLFERSEEAPGVKGLSLVKGEVLHFRGKTLIIPHMGWNRVRAGHPEVGSAKNARKKLFRGVASGSFFYFAHSYYCRPKKKSAILTKTRYGIDFASSIHQENIWAIQFHPEKSQELGLKVFNNFLSLCC